MARFNPQEAIGPFFHTDANLKNVPIDPQSEPLTFVQSISIDESKVVSFGTYNGCPAYYIEPRNPSVSPTLLVQDCPPATRK